MRSRHPTSGRARPLPAQLLPCSAREAPATARGVHRTQPCRGVRGPCHVAYLPAAHRIRFVALEKIRRRGPHRSPPSGRLRASQVPTSCRPTRPQRPARGVARPPWASQVPTPTPRLGPTGPHLQPRAGPHRSPAQGSPLSPRESPTPERTPRSPCPSHSRSAADLWSRPGGSFHGQVLTPYSKAHLEAEGPCPPGFGRRKPLAHGPHTG